jgi:integrase
VARLCWEDLDLSRRVAYVHHGKGDKAAWTLLPAEACAALAAWYETAGRPAGSTPVFPGCQGGHCCPESIGRRVQKLLKRAGLWSRGIGSAHRFRRTFATQFLRANPGDLEGLRRLMRHEQIATTVRYAFLEPEDLAARLARVQL